MLEKYSIRTDLALEEKERFESDNVEVQGEYTVTQYYKFIVNTIGSHM